MIYSNTRIYKKICQYHRKFEREFFILLLDIIIKKLKIHRH